MFALYGPTMFLAAFLLFLVQPMVARLLLPQLGGSPSVWNTCMVFFQATLLAGYAYAHAAPARLGVRRHAGLHLAVLALPLLALPIRLSAPGAAAQTQPALWLLGALLVAVGAPAFALATTAPLLQRWFAHSGNARDPYRLYVASNLGSLTALIAYPLVIEPHVRLAVQRQAWAAGYGLLVVLCALCAVALWRSRAAEGTAPVAPASAATQSDPGTSWRRWTALAFVPSSLMLGVTLYITTDIAPIPLLWVMPLGLYLATYVIAFSGAGRAALRAAWVLLPFALAALALAPLVREALPIGVRITLHLAAFTIAALVCHGELAASRPAPERLTAFYFWIALGGVLGGVLNALVAPMLFPRVLEYPLMFAAVALLAPGAWGARAPEPARTQRGRSAAPATNPRSHLVWRVAGAVLALVFLAQSFGGAAGMTLAVHRDFFGLIRVGQDPQHQLVGLQHGTTVHGIQSTDPARRDEPLGYYSRPGPLGQAIAAHESLAAGQALGVIGLGAGTIACYAGAGRGLTFYEIDPAIERVARDTALFTYLSRATARGARLRVVLGDARLSLLREPERYGLLVVDAFSSDAIPLHLLTREAMRVYLDHLEPGGLLAFHVSSQYVRLEPALSALAADAGLAGRLQHEQPGGDTVVWGHAPSRWVVMAHSDRELGALATDSRWSALPPRERAVWTDDFASLTPLILWSGLVR